MESIRNFSKFVGLDLSQPLHLEIMLNKNQLDKWTPEDKRALNYMQIFQKLRQVYSYHEFHQKSEWSQD